MLDFIQKRLIAVTISALSMLMVCTSYADSKLELTAFNPGENSFFPVSSVIVSGPTEALLVDAQFQRNDAQTLVDMINATGKKLTTVYISHGDPDYYFGLDVIVEAFPDVKIVTSATTHDYIKGSMQPKLDYWGPKLEQNAPKELVLPEVIEGDTLLVDGEEIKVIGLEGDNPKYTYLWIPSAKAALGGALLYENMHAWIADSQTPESRQKWMASLDEMQALNPEIVIPGHYLGESSQSVKAIDLTREYVMNFESAAAASSDAKELQDKLKALYPDLGAEGDLELSAKVIMGEMQWP